VARLKEIEAQLERTEHQLQLLQQISRFMVKEASLQDVLAGINELIVEFMRCDACLIYLVDGDELVLCSANDADVDVLGVVRLRKSEGLTGWVAKNRRLLAISREAYNDERFKRFSALEEDTFEAFLSAPIIARNRVVGVVNVQHRAVHQHTGAEMEMLTTIGEQIGSLLVLARMAPETVEKANHLELVFPAKAAG
jgi:signal transduction protein with GAF and PtsI domain